MENKAQASLEYMVMFALSLCIFAAILYATTSLFSNASTQVGVNSAVRAVDKIKEQADFIYVHGHPSKTQVSVQIPSNIENISISGRVVKLSISSGPSYTDIYDVTKGQIEGNDAVSYMCQSGICKEGNYVLVFESLENGNITVSAA